MQDQYSKVLRLLCDVARDIHWSAIACTVNDIAEDAGLLPLEVVVAIRELERDGLLAVHVYSGDSSLQTYEITLLGFAADEADTPSLADEQQVKRQNGRAAKMGCGGEITAQEWHDIKVRYGGRCVSCGSRPRGKEKLSIDHVIPLSAKGSNTADNIQPLCRRCNNLKHTLHIDWRPVFDSVHGSTSAA